MKEKICNSISQMDACELNYLYGQIKLVKIKKMRTYSEKSAVSIGRIHEMTSVPGNRWSDAVMWNRKDRL